MDFAEDPGSPFGTKKKTGMGVEKGRVNRRCVRFIRGLAKLYLVLALINIVMSLIEEPIFAQAAQSGLDTWVTKALIGHALFLFVAIGLFRTELRLLRTFLGKPRSSSCGVLVGFSAVLVWLICGFALGWIWLSQQASLDGIGAATHLTHVGWAARALALYLVVPVSEEIIYRGLLFLVFLRALGKAGAVATCTALFVLSHVRNMCCPDFPRLALLGIASIVLFGTLLITRRLRYCICVHFAINLLASIAKGVSCAP